MASRRQASKQESVSGHRALVCNPASPAALSAVLAQLGLQAEDIITEAQGDANKLRLRSQTELARTKGVFGAPTFFVGEEMFWGNDRLDDALACASASNPPAARIS